MKGNSCLYQMMYLILMIFDKYFLIVHISLNFVLINLRFLVAVDNIYSEGTVSQDFVLSLSFYLM